MQDRTENPPVATRPARRWPVILIAAPAAVSIWSGWVGLGALCGFGVVHPLPGIADGFRLDTAITLPVGVEAYGAYALGVWMRPSAIPARARRFAKRSAVGALMLGMLGQVVFHLLAARHAPAAPWPVVVLVSCLPVVVLGFGAGLTHLLRAGEPGPEPASKEILPAPADVLVPEVATAAEAAARAAMEASVRGGNPLSRNQLETRFRLTRAEATKLRAELVPAPGPEPVLNGQAADA